MSDTFIYTHSDGRTSSLPTHAAENLFAVVRILDLVTPDNLVEIASRLSAIMCSIVARSLNSTDRKRHATDLSILARIGEILLHSSTSSTHLIRDGLVTNCGLGRKIGENMGEISKRMERVGTMEEFNTFQDEEHELLLVIERLAWMMGKLGIEGYQEVCGYFSLWPEDLCSEDEEKDEDETSALDDVCLEIGIMQSASGQESAQVLHDANNLL